MNDVGTMIVSRVEQDNQDFQVFASRLYQIGQGRSIMNDKSGTLCGSHYDSVSCAVRLG
jgi:hypothetical protein